MTTTRTRWRVPVALLVLTAVPVLIGAVRLTQLVPVPLAAHIAGSIGFCVLGAFQFVPALRRRAWHRVAGRASVLCGLTAGLTALWLTGPGDDLLAVVRLVFGAGMVAALVLGWSAIRRRDVVAHRAWLTRAYAIGAGVGTQAVLLGVAEAVAGPPGETTRALVMAGAWLLNLVVAETIIRRRMT